MGPGTTWIGKRRQQPLMMLPWILALGTHWASNHKGLNIPRHIWPAKQSLQKLKRSLGPRVGRVPPLKDVGLHPLRSTGAWVVLFHSLVARSQLLEWHGFHHSPGWQKGTSLTGHQASCSWRMKEDAQTVEEERPPNLTRVQMCCLLEVFYARAVLTLWGLMPVRHLWGAEILEKKWSEDFWALNIVCEVFKVLTT